MDSLRRIRVALACLLGVTVLGTVGYVILGFPVLDAVYQTITTVSTVGFREVKPMGPGGQVFTILLILLGVGTVLYNLGVILEAVTEGHLRQHLERRRMDKQIEALRKHVVIAGYGRVGRAATDYLVGSGHEVVVVDSDASRLVDLPAGVMSVCGDVTSDDVLRAAGVQHARALVASLDTDADTVYATLSARAMRADLVIVARGRTADSKEKMLLAGASHAVNPQRIGGRRMAVFALQPQVAEFLDVVMHDENLDFRMQEVHVAAGSHMVGRTLGDLDLRETTGAQILAIRRSDQEPFEANPADDLEVNPGAVLIALGTQSAVSALGQLAGRNGRT